jgi:hypothetical protein
MPMPKTRAPELDSWLDQEISSLVEEVATDANGHTPSGRGVAGKPGLLFRVPRRLRRLPKALLVRERVFSSAALHDLRLKLRRRSMTLNYLAYAVVLGVLVGWLTVTFTKP